MRLNFHIRFILLNLSIVFNMLYFTGEVLSQQYQYHFELGASLYENKLSSKDDIRNVVLETKIEGQPQVSFKNNRMQLSSDSHFLLWFPFDFPDSIAISWDFLPKVDEGLAMLWFCAKGKRGEGIFSKSMQKRNGHYPQYHSGDINAYHMAYFRRNPWDKPHLNTVNLRKSYGNKLLIQGPNPIPNIASEKVRKNLKEPYRIQVIKYGEYLRLTINGLLVFELIDTNPLQEGKIGFRQMANLEAEYSNLKVNKVEKIY